MVLRSIRFLLFLGSLVLVTINAAAAPKTYKMTSIDYPDAIATNISGGINDRGDIVGAYTDSNKKVHGFLFSDGTYTAIDVPGATITQARGINSRGDIVGSYQVTPSKPGGDVHGFVLSHGELTIVNYPNHLNTIIQRISATGVLVGCYHDQDVMGTMHGIKITANGFESISMPASMNNGTSPEGTRSAGHYTDMMSGLAHGYVIDNGTFSSFDVPGSTSTAAWDMNPSGDIVGVFVDQSNKTHGFLWTGGEFFSIDFQGATITRAFGINARGDIVGTYVDSAGHTHGFLAERAH
jgi:probable HAF family extracellular repeat protein